MATFEKFEDMEAWQNSRELCQELFLITERVSIEKVPQNSFIFLELQKYLRQQENER